MKVTPIFEKNYDATEKIVINRGGTRSSKTYSLAQLSALWLMTGCYGDGQYCHVGTWSTVRKYRTTLDNTVIKDFEEIMSNEGFYDKGIELFQEVVENRIDETAAEAQFYIADAYKNQNRMEEARESYLKVRYIYPAFDSWVSRATIEAGDIYLKEENFAEARRMFESVLRKHENDEFGRIAREKIKLTENR